MNVYQYSRTDSSVSWRNFLQSSSLWCELNDLRNQTFQRELIKFFKKTLENTLIRHTYSNEYKGRQIHIKFN